MKIIAIETATECCSAALYLDGQITELSEVAPRRHGELILPMIERLLNEAGIARGALDAIAVGRGPGAFTGVRLGISVAQGIALGLDLPVIPVSSLAALAHAAPNDDASILATIDARMGEVYAGVFVRDPHLGLRLDGSESVGPAAALAMPRRNTWSVVGTGWLAYADALRIQLGAAPQFADGNRYPQARAVARLAASEFPKGAAVAPEMALPVYLRDKVALTLAEQRSA